jgi:hypothetical protein
MLHALRKPRGACTGHFIGIRFVQSSRAATLPLVERLNSTLEDFPVSCFAAHVGSSFGVFGLAYVGLQAISFDAPAIACAGIVSRLTKRLRTPLDLSLAAALAHAVPASNALKLGPLVAAPMQQLQPPPSGEPLSRIEGGIIRFADWAQGPVNTYGGPFFFVRWCSGLTTVAVTTACVHHGLDVVQLVGSLPFVSFSDSTASSLSGTASCVGGAMLINTVLLPVRLILLALFGREAFEALSARRHLFEREYRSMYRRQLRREREAACSRK